MTHRRIDENGKETRVYPMNCTSAFCGRDNCEGCKWLGELTEFKAWKEETKAVCEDYIWSPNVWTAQVG